MRGKHLIGMQGPFSRELNAAMLRQYDCRYLVTKDTGKAGGFQDKIDAALECDAVPVIIGRPLKEEGMSVRECKRFLTEHFSLATDRILHCWELEWEVKNFSLSRGRTAWIRRIF